MHEALLERGFLAGVELSRDLAATTVPDLVLFAVTEKRTRDEMDAFVEEVASL